MAPICDRVASAHSGIAWECHSKCVFCIPAAAGYKKHPFLNQNVLSVSQRLLDTRKRPLDTRKHLPGYKKTPSGYKKTPRAFWIQKNTFWILCRVRAPAVSAWQRRQAGRHEDHHVPQHPTRVSAGTMPPTARLHYWQAYASRGSPLDAVNLPRMRSPKALLGDTCYMTY